jgi:hypothetical protein
MTTTYRSSGRRNAIEIQRDEGFTAGFNDTQTATAHLRDRDPGAWDGASEPYRNGYRVGVLRATALASKPCSACGHPIDRHRHLRPGRDCGGCPCRSYAP